MLNRNVPSHSASYKHCCIQQCGMMFTIYRGKPFGVRLVQMITKTSVGKMGNTTCAYHLCNSLLLTESLDLVWRLVQDLELPRSLHIPVGDSGPPLKMFRLFRKVFGWANQNSLQKPTNQNSLQSNSPTEISDFFVNGKHSEADIHTSTITAISTCLRMYDTEIPSKLSFTTWNTCNMKS